MQPRLKTEALVFVFLLSGCGPFRASTDPDAMSETAHRERAAEERRRAASQARQYDPSQIRASDTTQGGYEGIAGSNSPDSTRASPPGPLMDPGQGHLSAARRMRELAHEHEAAADELVSFEARECSEVAPEDRASCPLLGSVRAVTPIETGVALELRQDTDPRAVLSQARCHAAFGRRRGHEGMAACPLYVEGVHVEIDGQRLLLTLDGGSALDDLRARAATHVVDDAP